MSRPLRPLLAAGALVGGALVTASVGASRADAAVGLDVYNLKANASPIEVAVKTQYSFLVYPDAQMPRATASIEGSQVMALASPADPGDGIDALPGLFVPQVEGQAQSGLAGGAGQAPEPFKTVLTTAANVISVVALANPFLTTPYEHVQVTYPNVKSPGRQQAAYFGTDPSVADPTGSIAVQAAAGKVVADKDLAIADAGIGGALTVAPLGLHVGRSSAHVELHGSGDRATSDAVSEVHDVDLTLPGLSLPPGLPQLPSLPLSIQPLLHIGAIVSTVHTERVAGAPRATSTHSLQVAGVTVLGQAATIDDHGVHLMQQNASLQPIVDAVNQLFTVTAGLNGQLRGLPLVGGQPIVPTGSMAGPLVGESLSHNGNEDSVTTSGLTLSLTGTLLLPSETTNLLGVPPQINPSSPPTLVASPATFTITLAAAQSSAYGYVFPPLPLPSLPPLSSAEPAGSAPAGGLVGGGYETPAASVPTATETATGGHPPSHVSARPAASLLERSLLAKPLAVALASLAELLILAALVAAYRLPGASRTEPAAPDLDMA